MIEAPPSKPAYVIDIEGEKKEITSRYRKLLRSAQDLLKDEDRPMVRKAFELAVKSHEGMRRKSGEPYIYHPIAVAQICVEEIGLGPTAIIASLLHDVVEDTDVTLEQIEKIFGSKVAKIIDGLTKIEGVFTPGASAQAENFRKLLLSLSEDVRVMFIKLADRLHNLRTLESMPRKSQLKIASETIYMYAPLAHRLGLYSIKSEMEDLWLKFTHTDDYNAIVENIKQTKAARNRFIKDFITPLDNQLKKSGLAYTIKGRPKSVHSIWNKMKKQAVPFEKVYDLFAIRIIVDVPFEEEKSACWQVYSLVTDIYKPSPERLRDWISTGKSNGYESLHTTVMSKSGTWVEVQIRTNRMDEIAEKGYAAHWKYKENVNGQKKEVGLESWLVKVRELMEANETNAVDFINEFRANLFTDEVYVFTPRGDLKVLPAGATALDFAFEIHSDVGSRTIGAKVNNKLVPLSHELNNGDQVEVLTSTKQRPNEDWLKFVKSSKAIAKIKEALKSEKKLIAQDGKELLIKKLKGLKMDLSDELLADIKQFFGLKTSIDVYYRFAKGFISNNDLKRFKEARDAVGGITAYMKAKAQALKAPLDPKAVTKELKVKNPHQDYLLIGEDLDNIDYTLSKCCNPIPGDDVFGFVTVSEGIKIHRVSCPNAVELMSQYGYRIIKAKWNSQTELAFMAGLRLTGTDRMGIVNDVSRVISNEMKVNMRSITIETKDGIFTGQILVLVQDTEHLSNLIQKLKRISGIDTVHRFDNVYQPT